MPRHKPNLHARGADSETAAAIAAVIPAAGVSRRMNCFKPLLPVAGRPMLLRVIDTLSKAAGIGAIVVVTGHRAAELTAALRGRRVTVVKNPHYREGGMLSSIKTGLRQLPDRTEAVVLALADQPVVRPATLRALLRAWRREKPPLVVPVYKGRRGHPIVMSSKLIAEAVALPRNQTLQSVTRRHLPEALQIAVDDPAVVLDVDTPQDYRRAVRIWEKWQARR